MLPTSIQRIIDDKTIKRYSTEEIVEVNKYPPMRIRAVSNQQYKVIESRLIKTIYTTSSDEKSKLAKAILTKFKALRREQTESTNEEAQGARGGSSSSRT